MANGRGSVTSKPRRDLVRLLADAVDRLLGTELRHVHVDAVRRLDPVAVELVVGVDVARGEVERRGARFRSGVDEDGAPLLARVRAGSLPS